MFILHKMSSGVCIMLMNSANVLVRQSKKTKTFLDKNVAPTLRRSQQADNGGHTRSVSSCENVSLPLSLPQSHIYLSDTFEAFLSFTTMPQLVDPSNFEDIGFSDIEASQSLLSPNPCTICIQITHRRTRGHHQLNSRRWYCGTDILRARTNSVKVFLSSIVLKKRDLWQDQPKNLLAKAIISNQEISGFFGMS